MACTCTAPAQCPKYTIEVISGETCGKSTATWVYPNSLNDAGHVAGHINVCQLAPNDAFTWDGGEIELIPMPDGTSESIAYDLNDNSWVVGEYVIPGSIPRAGFLTDGVEFISLLPEQANWSVAFAVNNDQVAVGFWYNTVTGIPQHACIWNGSKLTNIDGLPGPHSKATDINALGQVCGWTGSTNSSANARGFVYAEGGVTILPPIPEGGESSVATAINNAGHIAGWGRVPSDGLLPFLQRAFLWIDGEMTLLGVLPGMEESITYDMNDADQIVGSTMRSLQTRAPSSGRTA
jgi:probable HAF family extracellular repeat protein